MAIVTETTKLNPDALDDVQFAQDGQEANDPAKKKRKRNNKKNKAAVPSTEEPPALDTHEDSNEDAPADVRASKNDQEADDQQEQSTENQAPKRQRKRNNKNKTPVQSTEEPPALNTHEASDENASNDNAAIENASNDQSLPVKKARKNPKSNKPNGSSSDQLEKTAAVAAAAAARLRRLKEKKQAKSKLNREALQQAVSKLKAQAHSTAEESANESSSIGLQPPDLQLNYLKDRQKRALSDLSDLELESYPLEKSWLQDVSDKPLRAHLGPWLKTGAVPGLLEALDETTDICGSPIVLVVTSAAIRAADLYRQLRPEKPKNSGQVTKLFAKHFKLEEHIKHVEATKISIGVGTPHRIASLLATKDETAEDKKDEEAPLKLTRLKFIIFDLTWVDHKGFNLAELPDSVHSNSFWMSLLGFPGLIKRFQSGQTKLVFF